MTKVHLALHWIARKEVGIEDLFEGVGDDRGKPGAGQTRLIGGQGPRLPVGTGVDLLQEGLETRAVAQGAPDTATVLADRGSPTVRAAGWLVLVFEQVQKDDDQIAFQGMTFRPAHGLDLLKQVFPIQLGEPAITKQDGLVLQPGMEILVIQ